METIGIPVEQLKARRAKNVRVGPLKITPINDEDVRDTPFSLGGQQDRQSLHLTAKRDRMKTRGRVATEAFKAYRAPVTVQQRARQRDVYRQMAHPKDTTLQALKDQGKPCHEDLHTPQMLPDLHKQAAFVRREMKQNGGGASPIIFKYDQIRKKHAVFALVQQSLKYFKLLSQVLEDVQFYEKHPEMKNSEDMVHVLVYDSLFGQGLDLAWPGPALGAVYAEHHLIRRAVYQRATNNPEMYIPFKGLPRYARVNTMRTTLPQVVSHFKGMKYKLIDVPPSQYFDLKYFEFCVDKDIPNLLVFAPGVNLTGKLLDNDHILLQDKASCFSAYALLHPSLESKPLGILDGCAAPGNKTLHLAALLREQEPHNYTHIPLYAVEKDRDRFKALKSRAYKLHANVECINSDFLLVDPSLSQYSTITHILVDPSCSGSGIVSAERYAFSSSQQVGKTRSKRNYEFLSLPDDFEDTHYDAPNPDYNFERDDMNRENKENKEGKEGKKNQKESSSDDNSDNSDIDSDYNTESESDGSDSDDGEFTQIKKTIPPKKDSTHQNESTEQIETRYSVSSTGDAELKTRITNLSIFQKMAVKHAFKFPAVERVVYSTCSIYIEENERVVEEILKESPDFKLVKALPDWGHRGFEIFEGGNLCARASPQEDSATGFFVACFERKHKFPRPNVTHREQFFSNSYNNKPVKAYHPPTSPKPSKAPKAPKSNTPDDKPLISNPEVLKYKTASKYKKRRGNPAPIVNRK